MSDLFDGTAFAKKRKKPQKMAHIDDIGGNRCCGGGDGDYEGIATFKCARCGWLSDWLQFKTMTEAKRGVPCPVCNKV